MEKLRLFPMLVVSSIHVLNLSLMDKPNRQRRLQLLVSPLLVSFLLFLQFQDQVMGEKVTQYGEQEVSLVL
jgi:hypothetical protein